MELIARGIEYPYRSQEEHYAIEALKWQWHSLYLSSMAALSPSLNDTSTQSIMDNVHDHFSPESKYKRVEKVAKFQKMFENVRKSGPIKIRV